MSLLVAFDISTKALTGCVVPLEPTPYPFSQPRYFDHGLPTFKTGTTTPQLKSIERCRAVKAWRFSDTIDIPGRCEVVAIEEPFGAYKGNELREVYGALISSVPSWAHVIPMTAQQWRRKLWSIAGTKGAVDKEGGRAALRAIDCDGYAMPEDEHRCDALGLALAVRAQWWADQAGMA